MPAAAGQVTHVSEVAVEEGGVCEDYPHFSQKVFAILLKQYGH